MSTGDGNKTSTRVSTTPTTEREAPPSLPEALPFEATVENIPRMKAWILNHWKNSVFNQCNHRPLPLMDCSPVRIHIDPTARLVPVQTAATVPIHLREAVRQQLEDDVALGVLEKVPVGTPTTWQAMMHVVMKPDGSPRRTIDFRALNKH